jgi:hypothetical protein
MFVTTVALVMLFKSVFVHESGSYEPDKQNPLEITNIF